jgi:hypothetical protein
MSLMAHQSRVMYEYLMQQGAATNLAIATERSYKLDMEPIESLSLAIVDRAAARSP